MPKIPNIVWEAIKNRNARVRNTLLKAKEICASSMNLISVSSIYTMKN
jgi:hypothetical protein